MLGARRTFKVKRKRMKNKLKFKKASLNATDLMKGEDGMSVLLKKKFCLHLTHLSTFLMFTLSFSFFQFLTIQPKRLCGKTISQLVERKLCQPASLNRCG